ncbi:MAG: formyltransferase family protein [Bacteroidia bacterium]|nr:phosphoribosylglycinamide formyltransferase [Bacteroidia bacterium]MDW8014573.1 formyltransferase family protein [Bacteroidia bacterium]
MSVCIIAYSGRGRLARAVAAYLLQRQVPVRGVIDRPTAHIRALEELGVKVSLLQPQEWLPFCEQEKAKLIVLAGYLSLVPAPVVQQYLVVNSHPSLLPAFGGKGMYGYKVHQAVAQAGAAESGFTIHLASEQYDEGPILYQVRLPVEGLSPQQMEAWIQAAEKEVYPAFIYRLWCEEATIPLIKRSSSESLKQ